MWFMQNYIHNFCLKNFTRSRTWWCILQSGKKAHFDDMFAYVPSHEEDAIAASLWCARSSNDVHVGCVWGWAANLDSLTNCSWHLDGKFLLGVWHCLPQLLLHSFVVASPSIDCMLCMHVMAANWPQNRSILALSARQRHGGQSAWVRPLLLSFERFQIKSGHASCPLHGKVGQQDWCAL